MKHVYLVMIHLLILLSLPSCEDNEQPAEGSVLESFDSLVAESDTLRFGDSTKITAYTEGKELKYIWQTNSNAPLISIPDTSWKVIFYADPCVGLGASFVYCEVIGKNRSEEKKIAIVITE